MSQLFLSYSLCNAYSVSIDGQVFDQQSSDRRV